MKYKYDILLKQGTIIDPVNNLSGTMDLAVKDGQIAEISPDIDTSLSQENFNLEGFHILPGIVDLHVHASSWLGGEYGHKMLAKAGVTTALDMSGPIDSVLDIASNHGVGLNLACLNYVKPGDTVNSTNPGTIELNKMVENALEKGAYGIKILGGHYPLSPEATEKAIDIASKSDAYCAFHAGTLNTRSDLEGLREAVELIGDNPIHLAHINSYCRGKIKEPIKETQEAIELLNQHPNICSESYLSRFNGTSGKCVQKVPESQVTAMCLTTGNFAVTQRGLEDAIMAGWAQVNVEEGGEMILAEGEKAVTYWKSKNTDTTISFQVNPKMPRLHLATAKRKKGDFVVDCISTDGGGIPRNVIVEYGLSLVRLQALTLEEFVLKTSRNPAGILGLVNKGHFTPGADADITVVHLKNQKPMMAIANGKVIMWKGKICGSSTQIITTPMGKDAIKASGLMPQVTDFEKNRIYQRDQTLIQNS
jgi:predicted amidohydrolase